MTDKATNHLSVYLIKEEFHNHDSILKDIESLQKVDMAQGQIFYYGESQFFRPKWVTSFFADQIGDEAKIYNASSRAILLIPMTLGGKERIFALAFGIGWFLMNPGIWEERFGLRVTLNTIDPDYLRGIEKTNMSAIPKHANEQISRDGVAADFGIDGEQDLIREITGKAKEEAFGKTITGKDSLKLAAKFDINNINDFLATCYSKFMSDDYKKYFSWIDNIAEIKDVHLIEQLNQEMLQRIQQANYAKTWMAVPELIEWGDVSGFKYRTSKKDELDPDISLSAFIDSLSEEERDNLSLDLFKKRKVNCYSASTEQPKHKWLAYKCLYCEIKKDDQIYLLNNGKWYEIEKDFAEEVNADYEKLRSSEPSIELPNYNHLNENDYNQKISEEDDNLCCMDCNLIYRGGPQNKIEFCDILTKDKKIIHVKKYGGSSVLSHLFSQGLVSGELFLGDAKFRTKLNEKLDGEFKLSDPDVKPNPQDYEIIFAIISSKSEDLELPFFSKINIRNAKRRLETFGYPVSLAKIQIEESSPQN